MKLNNPNLTIYEVEDIQKDFELLLSEEENITIDLQDLSSIDMCGIQLLLSLKKSCEISQKEFQLINVPNDLIPSFEITGTTHILGV